MEVVGKFKFIGTKIKAVLEKVKGLFFKKSEVSEKVDVDFKAFRNLFLLGIGIFVCVIFSFPSDIPVEFAEKTEHKNLSPGQAAEESNGEGPKARATDVWGSPQLPMAGRGAGGNLPNYNASMIIGGKGGNAKTELRAGIRLPLRFLDKVIVSQDPVPVLAELILDSQSDSGLKLPAGTKFYGEAGFQKASERASVQFRQISLPSGQIKKISAMALGKDGQAGIPGRIYSDGTKNTAGQVITTFVGGLAAGSMETDILGRSKGGLENGLLGAVAATAQAKAQNYGEKLKNEREWIELGVGSECDALLNESYKLQEGGDQYE